MQIKIKKLHPDAVVPKYAQLGDAGVDLVAVDKRESKGLYIEYDIGLSIELPPGHVGLVFPRSSISKRGLVLCNSVGVIDSGYRGPIKCRFLPTTLNYEAYQTGERIAQLLVLPYPAIEYVEVEELSDTNRGYGGFGSTGV